MICVQLLKDSQAFASTHTQMRSYLSTRQTVLQTRTSKPEEISIIYTQFIKFSLMSLIIFSISCVQVPV